jgi:hypothetical protein
MVGGPNGAGAVARATKGGDASMAHIQASDRLSVASMGHRRVAAQLRN